jgi:hypothetical protein
MNPPPINLPTNVTLTLAQYTSLVALAREGAKAKNNDQVALEEFLVSIEEVNSITRYLLWVQWQEKDQPLPPRTSFPTNWPPELRKLIQKINSPVSLQDVKNILSQYATNPTSVMVTSDPNAMLGWSLLAQYFPESA